MTTPAWQAPINGSRTHLDATDNANHHNQFLSPHPVTNLSYGNVIVRPTNGDQGYFTHATGAPALQTQDFAQAFTMSGTTIGRITVPMLAFGNGADVLFTLCPDVSGNPNLNAPIAQVKVPASVITATGAETGLENATGVFQLPYNNTQFGTNFSQVIPWASPAGSVHGAPSYFATATSGNYSLLLGGFDTVGSAGSALCFTVQYLGGGNVAPPIPQPSLPQATYQGMAAVTPDAVVFAGGVVGGTTVANVWSASWNSGTGVIGAWSAQTALPTTLTNASGANFGETVYIVGGNTANTVASAVNTVYINKVSNGQLGSWTTGTPLPIAISLPFVGVIGNWLVVAGGLDSSNTCRNETWYAAINSDGSIGTWNRGPNMFQAVDSGIASWGLGLTTSSLIVYVGNVTGGGLGNYIHQLSVGPSGVAPSWNVIKADAPGDVAMSAFTDGNGIWYLMGYNVNNTAAQNFFQTVPLVSVPLYATGLTNSAQYWLVLQEVESGNATDYVGIGLNFGSYTVDAKNSNRHQNVWSTFFAGTQVPITVYDATPGNPTIHMVEDLATNVPGNATYQRWTTLAYNQQKILTGAIEVTMQPNLALNQNPTFTSGTSPWTATNGTLTQTSAQTHGGFPFSGLLTPTGGNALAYIQSEQIPIMNTSFGNTEFLFATGYFYTPTTWANFQLNINWFDPNGSYISTANGAITSLTGATWTLVSTIANVPATAAFATIVPTLSGTPGAANTLYVSNTYMAMSPENVGTLTSIAQVNYQTGTLWPPVGVTQLN